MKVLRIQKNSKNCIICGMENPLGLKAPFYVLDDKSVASIFTFRKEHQSYPERTHGGMISALLDELMGRTLWIDEPTLYGVTTTLSITFRRPVPFGEKLKARAYMTYNGKLGFSAKGEIYSMDNVLLAEGTCKYLKMSPEKAFGTNSHADDEMCYTLPIEVNYIDFPEKINP
ncbi:MAG: PaaI family thioesterase [Clostridia bacterium]|nr:PaaI family thioesterase [Clostridia bacterium]